MKKNLLLLLFVLTAAFSLTADILSEDYTLRLSDDGKTVIATVGKPATVTIPDSVTMIEESAFSGCTSLTSVTIGNSVTTIGEGTFFGCTSLTSVTIPNSVTTIGDSAFSGCTSLTSITIPNSVIAIGDSAFRGCTSLTSITIPNGVTTIGKSVFHKCTSLQLVIYDGAESDWYKINSNGAGLRGKTIVGRNRAVWTHTGN